MKEEIHIKSDYYELSKRLIELMEIKLKKDEPGELVIGIAGESGSGKSVTAVCLSEYLKDLGIQNTILHMDDYFHLPAADNHQNRLKGLDNVGPHEVNLKLLSDHVDAFRKHQKTEGPVSDFHGNRFISKTLDFSETQVLLVEGTYILEIKNLDKRIFLSRSYTDTLVDRMARGREGFDPFIESVLEIEHQIVSQYEDIADIVIDENFRPFEKQRKL
jgi:uridine kinase